MLNLIRVYRQDCKLFKDNAICGKGVYKWTDGREYNGDWLNNRIEGEGIFKFADGRVYTGHYSNDKKEGYGVLEWYIGL